MDAQEAERDADEWDDAKGKKRNRKREGDAEERILGGKVRVSGR